jgi:hypothetical protein
MKKKHLLVAASALVVGLSFGSNAWAGDKNDHSGSSAVAAAFQAGEVESNHADGTVGVAAATNINGTGLINVNVNAGANSELQGQNNLGLILNCSCGGEHSSSGALALAAQVGSVEGNHADGAAKTSSSEKSGLKDQDGHDGTGTFSKWHSETESSTPVAAVATLSGVGGIGMYNINVNAGANSLLQGQNNAAAIIGH